MFLMCNKCEFKVNKSQYKQRWVTPHFFTRQYLQKNILRKDKYRHNQLRKAFSTGLNLLKNN